MNPNDKPFIQSVGYGTIQSEQTNAEISLSPLTDEVLRDIARNESCSWAWRKAAVKFLINRQHKYQYHSDFKELVEEIKEDSEAEQEVKAVVESATEEPINLEG